MWWVFINLFLIPMRMVEHQYLQLVTCLMQWGTPEQLHADANNRTRAPSNTKTGAGQHTPTCIIDPFLTFDVK